MENVVELVSKPSVKDRLNAFATAYAENGGDHIKAYIAAGFSEKTAGQNAKKYLDANHDFVMAIVKRTMGQDAALARQLILRACTDETIPWGQRLKAIEMLLKNSGVQKDTLVIEDNKASDLTPEQRQAEIKELFKKHGQ